MGLRGCGSEVCGSEVRCSQTEKMNQLEKETHCGSAFGTRQTVGGARTIVRERIGVSE